MKQDKNGWGLAMMIVLMSILLVFLLLTTIMVYNLYRFNDVKQNPKVKYTPSNSNVKIDSKQKYKIYENRIKQNAITYAYTYYLEINEKEVKVSLDDLINANIMEELYDAKDKSKCEGYALLSIEDKEIVSKPYLKCSNYETNGYSE